VRPSKNLHDALENTAFQAKKAPAFFELSPAKKRQQRFSLGNLWNGVTTPTANKPGLAAFPAENPISPADLTATIYQALGVSADTTLQDRECRPALLTEGTPVSALFG
jgi:hypothetical protein